MFTDKDLALRIQQDIRNIFLLFEMTVYCTVKVSACPESEYEEFTKFAQDMLSQMQSRMLEKIAEKHPDLAVPDWTLSALERKPRERTSYEPRRDLPKPPLSDRSLLFREQEILLSVTSLLDYAVRVAREADCPENELKAFLPVIGNLMADVFQVLEPFWAHYPELRTPMLTSREIPS